MSPRERTVLRLGLGMMLGAAWTVFAAIFCSGENGPVCAVVGITSGMLVTWILTSTSLEHPLLLGVGSLPLGTMIYGTLLVTTHILLHAVFGMESNMTDDNPLLFGLGLAVLAVIPYGFLFLLPAIGSTYFLAVIFRKPKPRRRDLLPERWDG
jgi:hypothetical protein